jgi:hypothetical protein
VAERYKAWVCSRSPAEIPSSNPAGSMDFCFEYCVVAGRGLCDGLITRPEKSYRLWCVIVCDLETSRLRRLKPASGLWKPEEEEEEEEEEEYYRGDK